MNRSRRRIRRGRLRRRRQRRRRRRGAKLGQGIVGDAGKVGEIERDLRPPDQVEKQQRRRFCSPGPDLGADLLHLDVARVGDEDRHRVLLTALRTLEIALLFRLFGPFRPFRPFREPRRERHQQGAPRVKGRRAGSGASRRGRTAVVSASDPRRGAPDRRPEAPPCSPGARRVLRTAAVAGRRGTPRCRAARPDPSAARSSASVVSRPLSRSIAWKASPRRKATLLPVASTSGALSASLVRVSCRADRRPRSSTKRSPSRMKALILRSGDQEPSGPSTLPSSAGGTRSVRALATSVR